MLIAVVEVVGRCVVGSPLVVGTAVVVVAAVVVVVVGAGVVVIVVVLVSSIEGKEEP